MCGQSFSVDHTVKAGYLLYGTMKCMHLTTALLTETCTGLSIEAPLQVLEDEEFNLNSSYHDNKARLNVKVSNSWSKERKDFFDIKVFYPIAPSYRQEFNAIYIQAT